MLLKIRLHKFCLIIHNNDRQFAGCLFISCSLTCLARGAYSVKLLQSGRKGESLESIWKWLDSAQLDPSTTLQNETSEKQWGLRFAERNVLLIGSELYVCEFETEHATSSAELFWPLLALILSPWPVTSLIMISDSRRGLECQALIFHAFQLKTLNKVISVLLTINFFYSHCSFH